MNWKLLSLRRWLRSIRILLGRCRAITLRKPRPAGKDHLRPLAFRPDFEPLENRTSFNDLGPRGMLLAASGVAAGGIFVRALMARMVEPDRTHVASFSVGPADVPPVVPPSDPLADIDRLPPLSPVSSVAHLPNTDFVTQEFVNPLAAARMAHEAGNLPGTDLTPSLDDLSGDAGDAPDMDRPASADGLGHGGGGGGGGSASASGPEDAGVGAAIGGPHSGSPGVNLEDLPPANLLPNMPGSGSTASAPTTLAGESSSPSPSVPPPTPTVTPQMLASLPMVFEPNVGQVADRTQQFVAHGADSTLYLSATAATLVLQPSGPGAVNPASPDSPPPTVSATPLAVQMQFVGANSSAAGVGSGLLSSYTNYFLGSDPSQWYTNVANYSQVTFANAYSGIDLVYQSGSSGPLEYSLIVHPGADPSQVKLAFSGVQGMQLDSQGNLLLSTADGTVEEQAPVLYQDINGVRQSVSGSFVLNADGTVGITVGAYDHTQTLVIDPSISYSTYLGGSSGDTASGVAVDSSGNIYVSGSTGSTNFPTTSSAFQTKNNHNGGDPNAFVTKFNSSGALLWSTYYGGADVDDTPGPMTIDSSGDVYITGNETGGGLPTTSNAYQSNQQGIAGNVNAFVAEFNTNGNTLLYGSYLGASAGNTQGNAIAVDSSGLVYVAGSTAASNFPTQNPFASSASHVGGTYQGGEDGFLTRLNIGGSSTSLDFSTYLGGSSNDYVLAMAISGSGSSATVYLTGNTTSTNFPTQASAGFSSVAQSNLTLTSDTFVTRFNWNGSTLSLAYSTYAGGDAGTGIAVDSSGRVYLTGNTNEVTYPTVNPIQAVLGAPIGGKLPPGAGWPGDDAFVSQLNASGTAFNWATYLGGSGFDQASAIALDSSGDVWVTGHTDSTDFPTVDAVQPSLGGSSAGAQPYNAFVSEINSAGTALLFSTYLGGSGNDYGNAIALDSSGNAWVAGQTDSSDFPTTSGAAQGAYAGGGDAFVTQLGGSFATTAATVTIQATTNTANEQTGASGVFTVTRSGGDTSSAMTVYYTLSGSAVNGTDYDYLPGTVVIPAGATTATFDVVPLPSELRTGTQTVTATLTKYPGYIVGSPSSDTVTITDSTLLPYSSSNLPDPIQGYLAGGVLNYYSGSVEADVPLCDCYSLTYQSGAVNVTPIIAAQFASNSASTLTSLQTSLVWNAVSQGTVSFGVGSGASQQDLLAQQVTAPVTASGIYSWSLTVTADYSNSALDTTTTLSGVDPVVVLDSSSNNFGPGWSLSSLSSLVVGSAGVMMEEDDGLGARYFTGSFGGAGGTYTSPANDFGTLVKNSNGSYTYTDVNQDQENFNSSGQLTTAVDPDGLTTTYAYSGTELTSITDPGGAVTTFAYSGSPTPLLSSVTEPGNLTFTFTRNSSGDLTRVTDPAGGLTTFSYDSSNRLTNEQQGPLNTTYTYNTSQNVLTGVDAGGGVTTIVPQITQGLATMTAASSSANVAVVTDPNNHTTTYTFDAEGRLTQEITPDGGTQTWKLNSAGNPISYTDEMGRTTTYAYDAFGDVTQITNPDGSTEYFQYDPTFHQLTREQNSLGDVSRYAYNATGDLTLSRDPLGNVTTMAYSNGLLTAVTDPRGETTTYAYNSQLLLTTTTDALGDVSTYAYNSALDLTAATDPRGNTTTYAYDGMGRTTAITDPAGGIETMTYDAAGDLLTDTDPLGHTTTYAYNMQGELTKITDAANEVSTMAYDLAGNLTASTDPNGNTTTYAYDSMDRVTTQTDPDGGVTTFAYDKDSELTAETDPNGATTTFAYNTRGWLTKTTDALGGVTTTSYDSEGDVTGTIDADGNRTTYAYDADQQLTKITDALGHVSTMLYDADGNVTVSTDADGHTTKYAYNAIDELTTTTDAANDVSTLAYDRDGNVTASTDPLGHTTTYAYDSMDRETATTDPLGNVTTTAYDLASNVTKTVDPLGNVTTYAYNAVDELTKTTDAAGGVSTLGYDKDGNVTASTDENGHTTTYAYDSMDRLTRTTDPLNNVTTTAYDLDSNVTMTQDALGNRTTYAYDALDRQTAMITPSGGITTTAYDANSNVTKTVDPLGNVTSYGYDALNRQTNMTDATGGVTTYAYDAVGNTTAITDPDANTTTYAYDSINRETKSIDPLGNVTTYAYNAASDLTSTIDRDGRTITNAYDADDRLTTQVWLNSSGTATNTLTYAYDADSDLTAAANNAGTYTMSYDKLGDMTVEAEPFGATLTMAYDAVGNRTQVNDSFGGVTTSAYDADDRLTEREFSNGTTPLSFDMSYTSRSQLASMSRYNSLTQNGSTEVGSSAYTYNAEGLLTNLQHNSGTSGGGNLFNTTYSYDIGDRLTGIAQAGSPPVTYTYNALNELTGDTSSATPTYSYDANGNRTNPGDTVGTDNQISTDGTWTYTYDKEGNVTLKTDAAGDKWQYTYDNANELVGATYTPTGTTVASTVCTYVYDVFGNKIEQEETVSGVTTITKFAYDGSTIWAAMSSSNALQTRYVYMDGSTTPVAQISSGGTVNWYLTDYEGSVRIITNNSTGAAVDTITYDAYGNIRSQSSPVSGDFSLYAGGVYDSVLQMDFFGPSPYNPATGTWLRQDPLFPVSGLNPYEYCGDAPANETDPTGLDGRRFSSEGTTYVIQRTEYKWTWSMRGCIVDTWVIWTLQERDILAKLSDNTYLNAEALNRALAEKAGVLKSLITYNKAVEAEQIRLEKIMKDYVAGLGGGGFLSKGAGQLEQPGNPQQQPDKPPNGFVRPKVMTPLAVAGGAAFSLLADQAEQRAREANQAYQGQQALLNQIENLQASLGGNPNEADVPGLISRTKSLLQQLGIPSDGILDTEYGAVVPGWESPDKSGWRDTAITVRYLRPNNTPGKPPPTPPPKIYLQLDK